MENCDIRTNQTIRNRRWKLIETFLILIPWKKCLRLATCLIAVEMMTIHGQLSWSARVYIIKSQMPSLYRIFISHLLDPQLHELAGTFQLISVSLSNCPFLHNTLLRFSDISHKVGDHLAFWQKMPKCPQNGLFFDNSSNLHH